METQETWQEKTSTLEKIEEFKAATEGMSSKKKEKAFLRTFKGEYFIKKDDPKRPSATLFGIYGIPKDKNVAEISNGIFTFNGI